MNAQTQQQKRAAFALNKVKKYLEKLDNAKQKELKSHASGFPPMILMNGLGQAAAFYRSRTKTQHLVLYGWLSEWLCSEKQPYAKYDDLLMGITQSDMHQYHLAQAEALLLLEWIKQFVNAWVRDE